MNKTLKPEDLFDNPQDFTSSMEERPVSKTEIDSILAALAGTKTKSERQDNFIHSLPSEAQDALLLLRRMIGVETFGEMFYSCTPDRLNEMRVAINKIDLYRIWNAYENA